MKKLLLLIFLLIVLTACNKTVCPAYSDYANNMNNSLLQKGSHRADGINTVYRDSNQKNRRR